ncbi:hypothetical protein Tco_1560551, partial [Tanacetum coccineum]
SKTSGKNCWHYSSSPLPFTTVKTKGLFSIKGQIGQFAGSSTHGRVNISLLASDWLNPSKRGYVGLKISQGMGIFTLESLSEKAQGVTITDCHAGNPCVHLCDPRVENYSPMIESLYGRDG